MKRAGQQDEVPVTLAERLVLLDYILFYLIPAAVKSFFLRYRGMKASQ